MTTSDWCVGLPENRFEASNAGSPRKEKGTPWWLSRASKMGCSVVEQRADLGINFLLGCRGNVRLFLEYNKSRYFSRWIFPAIEIERDNKSFVYRMNTRWDKTTFKSSKVVNPGRVITGTKSSQFFPIGRSQHNLFVYWKKILIENFSRIVPIFPAHERRESATGGSLGRSFSPIRRSYRSWIFIAPVSNRAKRGLFFRGGNSFHPENSWPVLLGAATCAVCKCATANF